MADTPNANFTKLAGLLSELFQLDQADLDFGILRIMNQKRDEVIRFLEKDLLPQVEEAFSQYKSADILNLADDSDEERRRLYLTACLVAFYQQQKLYADNPNTFRPFLLEKPLWIFVGGSVNAVRTQNKRKVSDVVDILLTLAEFVKNKRDSVTLLERLLSGKPGLLDQRGNEIFAAAFPHLVSTKMTAEQVYDDILSVLFNSATQAALHVENLKGSDGEIALRLDFMAKRKHKNRDAEERPTRSNRAIQRHSTLPIGRCAV